MKCPKCFSPMVKVQFAGAQVDRCTNCQGLFFDELEKEALEKTKNADSIDIGDAKVGRRFNKVDRIQCPRCETPMMRVVALDQPHIWFEQCKVCGGSFLDAGEFRDLSHHTVVDFFKDLLVKERK
jgi:Zn-finger nucleic acid-binding protein